MRRFYIFTVSMILAIAVCVQAEVTPEKRAEYERLEKALVGGGTAAIIQDATPAGCFDRIKIVNGKEVKDCWGAMRPAGRDSKWECIPLSPNEAPECYGNTYLSPCSHRWIESAKGTKFCERCGIYAIQHINGEWMLVPRGSKWIGAEPK